MEEWRQFHCDLNDLTQWVTEAEELLADTFAADGGLDLEKARIHQQVRADGRLGDLLKRHVYLVCGI